MLLEILEMTDQVPHDAGIITSVIGGVIVGYTTLLGWLGKRQVARIDALESESKFCATRDDLDKHVTQLSTDIKDGFTGMHKRLDEHLNQHIANERRRDRDD